LANFHLSEIPNCHFYSLYSVRRLKLVLTVKSKCITQVWKAIKVAYVHIFIHRNDRKKYNNTENNKDVKEKRSYNRGLT